MRVSFIRAFQTRMAPSRQGLKAAYLWTQRHDESGALSKHRQASYSAIFILESNW